MLYSEESDYPFSWRIGHYGIEVIEHDGSDWNVLRNLEFMQYTGLKDHSGLDVFEGDILKRSDWVGLVVYDNAIAGYTVVPEYPAEFGLVELVSKGAVVVGNIHDSPELLRGVEEC